MPNPLSQQRRAFLAKSIMDVLKLVSAAAFATSFWGALPGWGKILLLFGILGLFLLAWATFPEKGEK